jgi:hypothetical protein
MVGSFGAEAQPASNKEATAVAGTNKARIGLILKIKGSVLSVSGGDFPTIAGKAELAFGNGHYYF